jgi:hypothetical protein
LSFTDDELAGSAANVELTGSRYAIHVSRESQLDQSLIQINIERYHYVPGRNAHVPVGGIKVQLQNPTAAPKLTVDCHACGAA